MSELEFIAGLLKESRWESARRHSLSLIEKKGLSLATLEPLHKALVKLGDVQEELRLIELCPSATDTQSYRLKILKSDDLMARANSDSYRSSDENKAGLSVDEYIEKYKELSRQARLEADQLTEAPRSKSEVQSPSRPEIKIEFGTIHGQIRDEQGILFPISN